MSTALLKDKSISLVSLKVQESTTFEDKLIALGDTSKDSLNRDLLLSICWSPLKENAQ